MIAESAGLSEAGQCRIVSIVKLSHCRVHSSAGETRNRGRGEFDNFIAVTGKVGGRDRVRTCDPLLAKQVLSQLSYTPKPMFLFILNQLRFLAPLETIQTVPECAKSVPNKLQLILDDCANWPDTVPIGVFISFACRSSFCSASLFICNFICEYFLKT